MKCPKCQFENREGAKFCKKCGAKSEPFCPKCDALISSDSHFCDECGYDLSKSAIAPPVSYSDPNSYTPKHLAEKIFTNRSSIEGERKLLTVLFADVANFTSIAEKLDPEEVHQIMDECFRILMDEIHKYEGTVNQFTGDGIMALFGAPLAHEDHAQRACLAAISIQKVLGRYGQDLKAKFGIDFRLRIGINSGPVVVGSIGDNLRMDYTAIGDTTNLAARMESLAEPGGILISEATYEIVSPYFSCKSLGQIKLKGKKELLNAYKLEKSFDVYKPRLGFEREIYSEIVGRKSELELLEHILLKSINGSGSIINIIGEAGIGKSRLVAELFNKESIKKIVHLEGRAISIGSNLSYHPIIEMLKQWADIKLDDNDSIAFEKLKRSIQLVCEEEASEVLPFIATLMRINLKGAYSKKVSGIEGDALQKIIIKNMRTLLIKATDKAPLCIIIEDLHWADISTIELIESIFRLVKNHRLCVISVFRPGFRRTGDRILNKVKDILPTYSFNIKLKPLDDQQSQTLIDNILKLSGFNYQIKKKIVERTGGNPFFIEEIVRSFIDQGVIISKDSGFEATEKLNSVFIPRTINDVLVARIDRLEERTKELVKIASVIGRNFFYRVIIEVANMINDIDKRLQYLKDRQFIFERKRMDELEYIFKHALAQQAAYESILTEKRKELHLRVANSIRTVFESKLNEFYGMLAYHYGNADDFDKAEDYMIKAGEEAQKASASSEALYYFQNAMELYLKKAGAATDPIKMSELEENIGIAFFDRGYYDEAIHYLTQALLSMGIKQYKKRTSIAFKLFISFVGIIYYLYISSKRQKIIPSDFDKRIVKIILRRGKAYAINDAKRMILESIYVSGRLFRADISKSQLYFDAVCALSSMFSYSGLSFTISKKLLEYAVRSSENSRSIVSLHFYYYMETIYNCLYGSWYKDYVEDSTDYHIEKGDLNAAALHLRYYHLMNVFKGNFEVSNKLINKLEYITENFDHDYSKFVLFMMKSHHSFQKRHLTDTIKLTDELLLLGQKLGAELQAISIVGMKMKAQVMLGEFESAERTSVYGENLLKYYKSAPPIYVAPFYATKLFYELAVLEKNTKSPNNIDSHELTKSIINSEKKAYSASKKHAGYRTEVYRLRGLHCWLRKKRRKALKWWSKSINEGTRLGARPELARTYMEVGKRLFESGSKYRELNGINANEYLNKASSMFKEMNLQWDLDELEKLN